MGDPNETLSKILQVHLERLAYIYIRQSSLYQVQYNTASTARQYNLVDRAKELGWPDEKIIVVDQDQGQSGASTEGRDGFKDMMREILMGNVGAVFSLEASRLARDSSDWHQLIKLCTTRNTLVIDESGIHNPRVFDDRLLLSIKGTLSDAELHLIASRLNGGRLQRAKEGKFRFQLAVGYAYDANRCIVIDPAPEVQQTVRLFFDQFDRLGSCLATVRYFRNNNLLLPNCYCDGRYHAHGKLTQLNPSRARKMLHNPIYAGVYVYGQSRTDIRVLSTETMETASRRVFVPSEEWAVVIRDHHEAYITEDRYRRNLQRLKDNRTRLESPGAINRGSALLQGLVRCGVCGRLMQVKYPGKKRRPVYECIGTRGATGQGGCQFFAATKVEAATRELVVKAFEPAQLELAEANFKHLETEVAAIRDQWKLQLVEAEKEAETAGRLFRQAAIQNRHVAGQLQNEWEQSLKRVEQIKQAERDLPQPPSPDSLAAIIDRLSNAAQNLDVIWHAPSTCDKDRKQLIRLLIKDVILLRKPDLIHMTVRWLSGGRFECEIPWLNFPRFHSTDAEVIEMIKKMAPDHTDRAIAERLNSLGYVRRWGQKKFDWHAVTDIRLSHKIPHSCPERYRRGQSGPRGDGRYSSQDVAKLLECALATVSRLCKAGELDAIRSTATSPWWIKIDLVDINKLKQKIRQYRKGAASKSAREDACARRKRGHHETAVS